MLRACLPQRRGHVVITLIYTVPAGGTDTLVVIRRALQVQYNLIGSLWAKSCQPVQLSAMDACCVLTARRAGHPGVIIRHVPFTR